VYKRLIVSILGAGLALAIPLASQAQDHPSGERTGRHPHYLHAMSDVSAAYLLIEHHGGDPPVRREEQRAMVAIEYAFSTLQNTATVVRKDPDDEPPPDDHGDYDHPGRLHRALDLLRDAHDQVDLPEEDSDARPLKDRALQKIDAAIHATEAAIRANGY
jgi:hypothetical protein